MLQNHAVQSTEWWALGIYAFSPWERTPKISGGTDGGSQTLLGNFEEKISYTCHKLNPDSWHKHYNVRLFPCYQNIDKIREGVCTRREQLSVFTIGRYEQRLCDGPITCPEKSPRVCCEIWKMRRPGTELRCCATKIKRRISEKLRTARTGNGFPAAKECGHAGRSHNIKMDNSASKRVEEFKYLGTTIKNQNSI
jgi:hypothetical protein